MTTVVVPVLPKTTKKQQKKWENKKFDNLIGPTDRAQDIKARESLVSARVSLLFKNSFFGNLATRLRLVNADEWCSTAATDGRNFYYNSKFINMLRPREVDFLFGHEVLHVVYDHMGRREDRDPQLWNIADDYCVNADLKRHGVGEFITTVPCLYESKYDGKSAEEVYDDLYEQADKIDLDQLLDKILDEHMDHEGGNDSDDEDGQEGDGNKKSKRPAPLSKEERDEIKKEIRAATIQAAQSAEAGQVPANVKRMVDSITQPKMPWRELIQANLTSTIKNDYSYMRPNRRSWHMDAIMPAMTPGEEVDIVVAIDTSGSISSAQCKAFLSEIQGIMDAFDGYRIHVFSFDSIAYTGQDFTSDNLESITDYVPQGGGGTDFDAIFAYLKENNIDPVRLIVFTDGYPWGSWGDPDYCDTTWIIHGDKNPSPPFGQWAIYEE